MRRRWFFCFAVLAASGFLLPAGADRPKTSARAIYKSPLGVALDPAGRTAYVALNTAGTLAVVDLETGAARQEIRVGAGPYDVALSGSTLYVTCEADDTLVAIDVQKRVVRRRFRVGQAPRGLVATPDGSTIYVACHDESRIWRVQGDRAEATAHPTSDWPDRLIATTRKDQPIQAISSVAGRTTELLSSFSSLPRSNQRGLARGPRSGDVFLVHQRPKPRIPTTQVAQGWVFTNALSKSADSASNAIAILDEPNRGFADPSDVVVTPDETRVWLTAAGGDCVLVLDIGRWFKHLRARPPRSYRDRDLAASDDLTASRRYVLARIPTRANPRRLALSRDGKTLVVSNYLDDSLTVIDAKALKVVRHISLGGPAPNAVRRGEILFNSGKMTFQGQFTCASCHPNGGDDGLTWDLTRDGVGNFKNTKSLLGVKDTAPYSWESSSPTLEDRVSGTLRTLHQHEPAEAEVADMVAYLKSLPPPRPVPVKDGDRAAVVRGKALFQNKAQCISCHQRTAFDDGKAHDVGTRGPGDTRDRFDTPGLRGAIRTAPYLHDGRAKTLDEVFTKHNPQQRHGAAHRLTREELADLIAYLKSL